MGYGMQIPTHRVDGLRKLWGFEVYGLSKSWVMRVSTVSLSFILRYIKFAVGMGYPMKETGIWREYI